MALEDPQHDEPEFDDDVSADELDEWDEETLGLDWNGADEQTLVGEVVPRGWDD